MLESSKRTRLRLGRIFILKLSRLLILFIACSFIACKLQKATTSTKENAKEQTAQQSTEEIVLQNNSTKTKQPIAKNDSLFATIERTVCFGKCPAYKIYIFTSGYVLYDGKMNVDKIGRFTTRLTKAELETIKQKAEAIHYFELNDKYDGPITDLPSVITSVAMNGYRKTVTARYNIPVELKEFQNLVDKLFTDKSWEPAGSSDK